MSEARSAGVLSGLFVLEVADSLGAAFATALLADYGATVIVCEPPEGTALRRLGPAALSAVRWKILARNKRSCVCDLADPTSQSLMRRLLERADILVVDLARPQQEGNPWFAVLESLAEADRPLVVEVFPTGADHPELWPYALRPEFAAAASGVMALTGHAGRTPIQAEAPLADYLAGTLAASKALLALRRERLGGGAPGTVATPLHQAIQRMIEWQCPVAAVKGRPETRMANNFPMNAGIANMHPTGDGGYVAISAVTQVTAERLMAMVGGKELAADPRFSTAEARMRGLDALYARIDAWTSARTTAEIMATAAAHDVVLGPIYTTAEIVTDEQIAARGNIVSLPDGAGGMLAMPAVTPRLVDEAPVIRHLGPPLGQDDIEACLRAAGQRRPAATAAAAKPLLVLELGAVIAGPFAGSLMADFGCRVIKVEGPGDGDSLRKMGPEAAGVPLWFATSARDKDCISLNLKHPSGKAIFQALIAEADMLIENFRPGVLERLGLAWDDLKRINPRLVMVSISGFGQTGPQRLRPGFGKIAEGLSGIVTLTGEAGQAPLFVGFSLADASTGLFGVFGAAALLYARDVLGGAGGRVDVALYEPLLRMLDCQLALHAVRGVPPARSGGNDPYSFGLAAPDRPILRCVASASGDWYLVALPHEEALDGIVAETLGNADLEADLAARRLEFAPIFDGRSMAESAYFQARRDIVQWNHPALGRVAAPGRLGVADAERLMHAPAVGADNVRVLREFLGLDASELDRLAGEGVI